LNKLLLQWSGSKKPVEIGTKEFCDEIAAAVMLNSGPKIQTTVDRGMRRTCPQEEK
jgi:hypothetical protein